MHGTNICTRNTIPVDPDRMDGATALCTEDNGLQSRPGYQIHSVKSYWISSVTLSREHCVGKRDFPSLNEFKEHRLSSDANSFSANSEIPRIVWNQKFHYRIVPNLRHISPVNALPSSPIISNVHRLAQDRDRWRTLVSAVMNLRVL